MLCLAPGEGLGIDDPAKRERIGEDNDHPLPPPRLTLTADRAPGAQ